MAEENLQHDKWVGTTYGNNWMHRWLIRMLKVIDVRLLYGFTNIFVVPATFLFGSKSRKATFNFYRKAFGVSKFKALRMTLKNYRQFSKIVIDKFAMYAGKEFHFDLDGYENFAELELEEKGFIQLSSHIGNYELAGYSLRSERKRFNALVFGGEKESVMRNREQLFGSNNIRMIAMKPDMSHLFVIDEALAEGEIISMPADRVFGSQKAFDLDFFGHKAKFPQGPFILAALRDVPVIFVAVMKTAYNRYHITVRRLDAPEEGNSKSRAACLASEYVALLQDTVKKYPAQWFNYFDFWS